MSDKHYAQAAPTKISYINGKPTKIRLRRCTLAPRDPNSSMATYTFDQGVVTVGAMDDNDIVLRDDTVSRYHCKIIQEEDHYILKDLGSTNGSFINQVRVREAFLSSGCLVRFGATELIFQPIDEEITIVPSEKDRFGDIIGASVRMREIFGILEKIAPTNATVVIEGETGTGKEVVAQTIHKMSTRAKKPFIVFDCGAVPESLIESELFGHEKGSFTGAIMTRQGLFELAQGGTIFLDELGELSLELQPKLLRVLEQREVRRVGSAKSIPINVRVIAATNRTLEDEVRSGRFREDLFYRLSVVRVFLPPLRERIVDLEPLVKHFLKSSTFNRRRDGQLKLRGVSPEAIEACSAYEWPGNIRELLNVVERACSLADGERIELNDLPDHISGLNSGFGFATPPRLLDDDELDIPDPRELSKKTFKDAKEQWLTSFESDYIATLLEKNKGNISHAAREADIDRKYFRKLMKKYDISADEFS